MLPRNFEGFHIDTQLVIVLVWTHRVHFTSDRNEHHSNDTHGESLAQRVFVGKSSSSSGEIIFITFRAMSKNTYKMKKKIVVVSRSLLPSSKSSRFLEPEYGYTSESWGDVCCWRTATKERERRRTRRNITFQVQQNILLYFSVRFFFVDFFLSEEERKFPTKKAAQLRSDGGGKKKHNTEILPALTQRSKKKISRNIPKKNTKLKQPTAHISYMKRNIQRTQPTPTLRTFFFCPEMRTLGVSQPFISYASWTSALRVY